MGGCSGCWETPGRQARSQGQAPRGRRRTPVSAVLAGPSSGPPSQIPEGCGFRSSPTLRPRPGPSCRPGASSLLITLSLPLFRVYPTVLIFTAIILSGHHPSPLYWTTARASQVVFPLPHLYRLSPTWHLNYQEFTRPSHSCIIPYANFQLAQSEI